MVTITALCGAFKTSMFTVHVEMCFYPRSGAQTNIKLVTLLLLRFLLFNSIWMLYLVKIEFSFHFSVISGT